MKILPGETIVWREGEEKRENGKIVVDNKIGNGAEIFITRSRIIFDRNLFFFFFFVRSRCVCHSRVSSKEEKEEGVEIREQTRANLVAESWISLEIRRYYAPKL